MPNCGQKRRGRGTEMMPGNVTKVNKPQATSTKKLAKPPDRKWPAQRIATPNKQQTTLQTHSYCPSSSLSIHFFVLHVCCLLVYIHLDTPAPVQKPGRRFLDLSFFFSSFHLYSYLRLRHLSKFLKLTFQLHSLSPLQSSQTVWPQTHPKASSGTYLLTLEYLQLTQLPRNHLFINANHPIITHFSPSQTEPMVRPRGAQ